MLSQLCAAWRAQRVLIIGSGDDACAPLNAYLTILGARCQILPPDAQAQTLYRSLTDGRVFAVIVCRPPASETLLREIRETGVPLTILCPEEEAQDAALCALRFGARFVEDALPGGVYDLNEFF